MTYKRPHVVLAIMSQKADAELLIRVFEVTDEIAFELHTIKRPTGDRFP